MQKLLGCCVVWLLLSAFLGHSPEVVRYTLKMPSEMIIKGTSNIHNWESSVRKINGTALFEFDETGLIEIKECVATINTKSIKSSKGSIMDKKTWRALKADQYSRIEYTFRRMNMVSKSVEGFQASVSGDLMLAGVTRSVTFGIEGKVLANGAVEIWGSKAIRMTDFNIDPPSALMGTLTTGEVVTIEFHLTFVPN